MDFDERLIKREDVLRAIEMYSKKDNYKSCTIKLRQLFCYLYNAEKLINRKSSGK
jgi:hypothetical protein